MKWFRIIYSVINLIFFWNTRRSRRENEFYMKIIVGFTPSLSWVFFFFLLPLFPTRQFVGIFFAVVFIIWEICSDVVPSSGEIRGHFSTWINFLLLKDSAFLSLLCVSTFKDLIWNLRSHFIHHHHFLSDISSPHSRDRKEHSNREPTQIPIKAEVHRKVQCDCIDWMWSQMSLDGFVMSSHDIEHNNTVKSSECVRVEFSSH